MKLLRFGPIGQEKPGCLDAQGNVRDLSGKIADITAATLDPVRLNALKALDLDALPIAHSPGRLGTRSEEHTSELQSLMRISYAVFCLKKKKQNNNTSIHT